MTTKEFINAVMLHDLERVTKNTPYVSFALMAIAIEFLGQCLNDSETRWNVGKPSDNFNRGLTMPSLKKYEIGTTNFMFNSLRNGMAHTLIPKRTNGWRMSFTDNAPHSHLISFESKHLILTCEGLYADLQSAFHEMIRRVDNNEFLNSNSKMYKDILSIESNPITPDSELTDQQDIDAK